jgi:head-tail adaptor
MVGMSLTTMLRQDVTILTAPTVTDRYNNAVPDWEHATSVVVKGWVQQTGGTELTTGRDTVIADAVLFLHPDAPITAANRVRQGIRTWEVVGAPNVASRPAGPHHLEVALRSIDG